MYDPTKPSTNSTLNLIRKTWQTPYINVTPSTYVIFKKKFKHPEVDHTDGIGTKGIYHWKKRAFKNAVMDALAMNLNDLLLVRARAYKLQNHLILPKDDKEAILEIVKTLTTECRKRNIAITGGETSIHNIQDNFDIGITVSGFIKNIEDNKVKTGDVVVGLKSNGIHSNGFTLLRKLFKNNFREEFIKPTKIYYDDLIEFVENNKIHGMMHITGGAYSKLQGIINSSQDINISNPIKPQQIFYDIYEKGITDRQMLTTFNCGTGFILTLSEENANKLIKKVPYAKIIGTVRKGSGKITVKSSFDNATVFL